MITGVVLARNEEHNIADCLLALTPCVDEILLIDMQSTDRTVELAKPYVSQVLPHEVIPQFDSARNIAIDVAKFDWLWFVDADERIPSRTGKIVRDLIDVRGHEFEALTLPFKTHFCGKWIEHCGWWPGYTMPRVLKRGHFEFAARLHGGVKVDGRQWFLPADPQLGIEHLSYRNVEHYVEKFNRYTTIEAGQLHEQGRVWNWRDAFRDMIGDLWNYYEGNSGHLDGAHGWILSWLAGQYRWFSNAKLIDLAPPSDDTHPKNLDQVLRFAEDELRRHQSRRPRVPLSILWRSPLWDPSGYAEDGRTMIKALAGGVRDFAAEDIAWSDIRSLLSETDAGCLKACLRCRTAGALVAITNCIPGIRPPDPSAIWNVIRTTFETDRIPEHWREKLAAYDEIWVLSEFNRAAFQRSGVAPERLRVVPPCVDIDQYSDTGEKLELPEPLRGSFVFLSVFDWQLRKGWDVLLRAYCQEFRPQSGCGLLLKITRQHGIPLDAIHQQIDAVLQPLGLTLQTRPDIVLWDRNLSAREMAALYRSVGAFVLASRGEGWGRPFMEAMAAGCPVIGTAGSGNADFMTSRNSILVPAQAIAVPPEAAQEISVYRGHTWLEPDEACLREALRSIVADANFRTQLARTAVGDVRTRFSLAAGRAKVETALAEIERRFVPPRLPEVRADQLKVQLEGEFFAEHSFSNINEQLARRMLNDDTLAVELKRVQLNPTHDRFAIHPEKLTPAFAKRFADGPQVTIRHAFPPNWEPVATGRWVHIQPWEFGHLPTDWVGPLRDRVDEIWAPSRYVRDVFLRSGIPAEKIQTIPWGIDPEVFNPQAPARLLPTEGCFHFVFVGGTISRKGFDILLDAFLSEFGPGEKVCLVVKDLGTQSFYRFGNLQEKVLAAANDRAQPKILYFDQHFTPGQLAGLYRSCQCLVSPYRGEGFGLPILEAMACGLPVIVPEGGPTDDFVHAEHGIRLPSKVSETVHPWALVGPATELSVEVSDVRRAMRQMFENQQICRQMGSAAADHVRRSFTWERTIQQMRRRLNVLTGRSDETSDDLQSRHASLENPLPADSTRVAVCVAVKNDEATLADCLCRVRPFVDEMIVLDQGTADRSLRIAEESDAVVLAADAGQHSALNSVAEKSRLDWLVQLPADSRLAESDARDMSRILREVPCDANEIVIPLAGSIRAGGERLTSLIATRTSRSSKSWPSRSSATKPSTASVLSEPRPVVPNVAAVASPSPGASPDYELRGTSGRYQAGKSCFQRGDIFHAECYLRDFLDAAGTEHANYLDAVATLGTIYRMIMDPFQAHDIVSAALKIYPQAPELAQQLIHIRRDIESWKSHAAGAAVVPRKPVDLPLEVNSADTRVRLYLGAGAKRLPGYQHVDWIAGPGIDLVWDLDQRPWPWPADSVDVIVAEDLVEHLQSNLIEFCNEAWRLLKPNGELFVRTPHYKGESSWIDPTHRWHLDQQAFQYLDPQTQWGHLYGHYTPHKWCIESLGVRGPQNICALLRPRK